MKKIIIIALAMGVAMLAAAKYYTQKIDGDVIWVAYNTQELTPEAAFQFHQDNPETIFLDIRTPREFRRGHIPGAVNINYWEDKYPTRIANLPSDQTYIIHCQSGGRSEDAMIDFHNLGLDIYHMKAGFRGWKKAGLPIETP